MQHSHNHPIIADLHLRLAFSGQNISTTAKKNVTRYASSGSISIYKGKPSRHGLGDEHGMAWLKVGRRANRYGGMGDCKVDVVKMLAATWKNCVLKKDLTAISVLRQPELDSASLTFGPGRVEKANFDKGNLDPTLLQTMFYTKVGRLDVTVGT